VAARLDPTRALIAAGLQSAPDPLRAAGSVRDHSVRAAPQPIDVAALGPTADSPKLPHGYLRILIFILFFNRRAKQMLTEAIRSHAPSRAELDIDPRHPATP
jgi:hypothetical protein